jgi:lauroyl/myristoyl acyltransferase
VARNLPRDQVTQQATQEFADQLGERIKKHPEHWYHFYRYWDAQRDSYEGLQ